MYCMVERFFFWRTQYVYTSCCVIVFKLFFSEYPRGIDHQDFEIKLDKKNESPYRIILMQTSRSMCTDNFWWVLIFLEILRHYGCNRFRFCFFRSEWYDCPLCDVVSECKGNTEEKKLHGYNSLHDDSAANRCIV